jgi:mRNA interferase MazF
MAMRLKTKGYMTTIKGGEIWIAEILYTNGTDVKKRPVLVLWVDGQDVVVAVVTSALPRTITDVLLNHWVESGLKVPSTVRLSRLDCLEISLFRKKVGQVSETDAVQLKKVWQESISLQF